MEQFALFDGPAPAISPLPKNLEPWKTYDDRVVLYHGDSLDVLQRMPSSSIDACVTDPPYGLGFMGKEWDTFSPDANRFDLQRAAKNHAIESDNPNLRGRNRAPAVSPSQIDYDYSVEGLRGFQKFTETWAREILRILTPGAHLMVCGAPRSAHRMVCGLEDAGFEIRDSFAWLFGQGFPKSHNINEELGTALKPGHEPICLARKPFKGTVEHCVEVWGTGVLNIEACRIRAGTTISGGGGGKSDRSMLGGAGHAKGRWPANVLLDEQAGSLLDEQAGERVSGANPTRRGSDKFRKVFGKFKGEAVCVPARGAEAGGASRFFFVAKPSRLERDFGCDDLPVRTPGECTDREDGSAGITPYAGAGRSGGGRNPHPTVKPVSLMRWLLRLVIPPGGTVIDPFLGSGTTGMAAVVDGYQFIGIEREIDYLTVSDKRIGATWREVYP